MGESYIILNVMGPYREPREPAMSFDYSLQRSSWATPQGVRVKIALQEELDFLKETVLELSGGTPGQQLLVNKILSKAIADQKLQIANEEGFFEERRDIIVEPFARSLSHLFPKLERWMNQEKSSLYSEAKKIIGF